MVKSHVVFVFLLLSYFAEAQNFPNPATLSTGQGAIGTNDPIWQVSAITLGVPPNPVFGGVTFSPAVIDNNCSPSAWVDPASLPSPVNNGNWITSPGAPCATNGLAGYLYYRLTLNLPPDCNGNSVSTPGVYTLSFSGYVDNTITDVFVNGTSTGIYGGSFSAGSQLNFTLNGPWVGGTNYVDILVNNAPGGAPNPYGLLLVANTTVSASSDSDNDGVPDISDNCMCDPGNGPDGCIAPIHPNNCNQILIRQTFLNAGCVELENCISPCSMYFYNPQSLTGSAAQSFAQSLGANLISIQSAAENLCITNSLNAKGFGGIIWIGFNDEAQEGNFIWYDQSQIVYTNWASSEPNNAGGDEDCTQIYPDGRWNDLPCNIGNSASVIEVNLCPQTIISNNALICNGNTTSLTANTILGSQPYSYSWSVPGTGNLVSVSPTANSTYNTTVTDRYQCTATTAATVNVYNVNISAGPDRAYCIGDSAQLAGNGTSRFEWSPTSDLSDTSIANPIASPSVTTQYIITGYDDIGNSVLNGDFNGGNINFTSNYIYSTDLTPEGRYWVGPNSNNVHNGFASVTGRGGSGNFLSVNGSGTPNLSVWCQTISVEPNTNYNFSAWVTSVASGSPAILQFSINGNVLAQPFQAPAATGQWDQFFATWNSGANASAQICIVNQNTNTGGNDFGIDDISFSQICQKQDTVVVTVNPLPLAFAGNDTAICVGDNVQLQASGGTLYTWSPTSRLSCVACNNPIANPIITTQYKVRVTDANLCVSEDSLTITVNSLPALTISGLAPQYCLLDNDALLTGNPSGGTFNGNGINGNNFSPSTAGTGNQQISYSFTDANNCFNELFFATTVVAMPTIDFSGTDSTLCSNDAASNIFVNPLGGNLYGTGITGSSFNPQVAGTGSFWIFYDYTDNNGCAVTDSILMSVNELPEALLEGINATCYGYDDGVAFVTASAGTSPYNYLWNNLSSDSLINNLSPGDYTVTVTDANGCFVLESISITEPIELFVDILPAIDSITLGDTVAYTIQHNADAIANYNWQPDSWLSCSDCENPVAIPQESIIYTLTITDTNTCEATTSASIFIKPKKAWYIPNIFSPNGDGINDILFAYIKGVKKMTFNIYNRWGEKVFTSTDPLNGWDGLYKGKEAQPGVYVYDIYVIYWDNEPVKATGSVTLVR
jgi:gliding motility-associated-like protein